MKSILVLGAGRIGTVIVRDLNQEYQVLVLDKDTKRLSDISRDYSLNTEFLDFTIHSGLKEKILPFDLVISTVPGFMGFQILKFIIECQKNVVDISFFNEDPYDLDLLAKKNNVTAVIDCGVAPGLCNIILGHHIQISDVISYKCYVGGLPLNRVKPFEYKAPFSPIDVIEEYVRPARMRVNGEEVVKEALSDIEELQFEQTGALEAFNTDGLRTLLRTTKVPDLLEKTIRYPGHAKLMWAFRACGLFSNELKYLNNSEIRPVDLTKELLFKHWKLEEDELEFTIMKIEIESMSEKWNYILYDKTDVKSHMSSMGRTTGFTCTSVARLIIEGKFTGTGIIAPEIIGMNENCFNSILQDLRDRNVKILLESANL